MGDVKPKTIKRRTMVELLAAVYEHHGWCRKEGESRPRRVQDIYEITANSGRNTYIATPRDNEPPKSEVDEAGNIGWMVP
jgi:hypothetical protein